MISLSKKRLLYVILPLIALAVTILALCPQPKGKEAVVRGLMNDFLNDYKSPAVHDSERLTDYTIRQVRFLKSNGQVFLFGVLYDVKPYVMEADGTSWMAGNGSMADNGWIVGKYTEVAIEKQGDGFVLLSMGLG